MGLSETKLKSVHPYSFFTINGFQNPFRKDRSEKSGGGILVYVKVVISGKYKNLNKITKI